MRHPRRGRNVALVVASLGAISVLVALWLTGMNRPSNVEVIVGVLGLKLAIVGGVLALISHTTVVRRYDRLGRREGVLLRWRIDAAQWGPFLEAAAALAQAPKALRNELTLPTEIPAEGIEVMIAADAFRLGPEFQPLQKNAIVRLVGPVLEIQQRVIQTRYSTRLVAYRLPAPENAGADVARLAERFTVQATQSRTLIRKVALVALVVALGVLAWVVIWAMSVGKRG